MEVKNKGSTDKGMTWEPIAVDADGHVKVDLASEIPAGTKKIGSVDVASYPVAGLLNKIVDAVKDLKSASKSGGGTDNLDSATVPTGKMWVITNINAWNADAAMTYLRLSKFANTTSYRIKSIADPPQNVGIDWQGIIILNAGQKIRSSHVGGAADNTIAMVILGYEITPP